MVVRPGEPPPPSRTPRTLAALGLGLLAVWVAPALAIGVVAATQTLVASVPVEPPIPEPEGPSLTWEQIDLAEDQHLRPPLPKAPTSHPTKTVQPEPVLSHAPLTLTLAPGLFATTATARCPDGTRHRASFEQGRAVFPALPAQEVCRISLQGGLVTSLRSGPGSLHCGLAATTGTVVCR